ncbi:MAG: tRNA 2-thiouridine(34) synthase MnmA, partial [Myxococcales bacterium]|nr:tRNA 2-thiouridine(34) synthase MnmA [Myxococcales bacterium]
RLYKSGSSTPAKGCCSPDDLFDARSVATELGIPFYVVNYQDEFQARVIDHFVSEYRRGRTPSPCVLCNDYLKFNTLLELVDSVGAGWLATGHYAQIDQDESGRWRLRRGVDPTKDQSYFLFGIKRELLAKILFPLGGMTKDQVRELAGAQDLPTATKAESQDLCFVGGNNYLSFLEKRLPESERIPGELVHVESGEVLGTHDGIHRYTIGQRKGLGIG